MLGKHDLCFGICGDGVGVQKKNARSKDTFRRTRRASFFFGSKTSLVIMTLLALAVSVLGDDTQALRDTLSSFCSLNKEGKFGSCCESYDISSVTLASSGS